MVFVCRVGLLFMTFFFSFISFLWLVVIERDCKEGIF